MAMAAVGSVVAAVVVVVVVGLVSAGSRVVVTTCAITDLAVEVDGVDGSWHRVPLLLMNLGLFCFVVRFRGMGRVMVMAMVGLEESLH